MLARAILFLLSGVLAVMCLLLLAGRAGVLFVSVTFLLSLATALVASRMGREASGARRGASPAPAPVAAVEPEDVADLREPITACPRCGYLGVRPLGISEGGIPGAAEISDKRHCPRCGYQGLTVTFERREDYRAFLKELATGGDAGAA